MGLFTALLATQQLPIQVILESKQKACPSWKPQFFYNHLIWEVTCYHICHKQLPTQTNLAQCRRELQQIVNTRGKDDQSHHERKKNILYSLSTRSGLLNYRYRERDTDAQSSYRFSSTNPAIGPSEHGNGISPVWILRNCWEWNF